MADTALKPWRIIDTAIARTRLDIGLNGLLSILYSPIGLLLAVFRAFLMLQVALILVVVAEGALKRLMLRIFFVVLGVVVTTSELERRDRKAKVLVGNRLSFIDYIPLHLALDCSTVSTRDEGNSPLMNLFPHLTFQSKDRDGLTVEARGRPLFDEERGGAICYAVQPEFHPTNGSSVLLPFSSSWLFALEQSVQPLALSARRLFGPRLTVAKSNGWWDLFWTLFSPITIFHIRMLPVVQKSGEADTAAEDFCGQVEREVAETLGLTVSTITPADFKAWLSEPLAASPPAPRLSPPLQASTTSQGPVITAAEFASLSVSSPPAIEAMVHQVAAVLPHVPHTAIRRDLLTTRSVDVTIANILEGQVDFVPLPHGAPVAPVQSTPSSAPPKPTLRRSSLQRHASLEERKKALITQARQRYLENHKKQSSSAGKKDSS